MIDHFSRKHTRIDRDTVITHVHTRLNCTHIHSYAYEMDADSHGRKQVRTDGRTSERTGRLSLRKRKKERKKDKKCYGESEYMKGIYR